MSYSLPWSILISKNDIKQHFVFYGGTAIKRIYFEDRRFSEDIDLISEKNIFKGTAHSIFGMP
ncbi:nucleotidyl transferase AbiEii/AbiGii toxin family protein [Legionella waltersii]|uniref:nucleotidyl transferase AbiEii/AbiGii toxin family protein n=1 Tax=Legionella waltersii TaxID=66969 RepID=UPI0009F99367